jgi:hypothetical protein
MGFLYSFRTPDDGNDMAITLSTKKWDLLQVLIEDIDWWICTERFDTITNVDNRDTIDKSAQTSTLIDWLLFNVL